MGHERTLWRGGNPWVTPTIIIKFPAMTSVCVINKLDENIRALRLELNRLRHSRWEDEREFHENREEMRCGITKLRSKIDAALDRGVDFQLFKDALDETRKDDEVPYNLMHFSHECLLLSTVHQMEARHNMLRVVGRQSKAMAAFFQAIRDQYEAKTVQLKQELAERVKELDEYVVDASLAQKVVAQRLVIRKLRSIFKRPKLCQSQNQWFSSRTIVSFHLEDDDGDVMDKSQSSRSVESPRDARLMPRSLSVKADAFDISDTSIDLCEVPL